MNFFGFFADKVLHKLSADITAPWKAGRVTETASVRVFLSSTCFSVLTLAVVKVWGGSLGPASPCAVMTATAFLPLSVCLCDPDELQIESLSSECWLFCRQLESAGSRSRERGKLLLAK